MECNCNFSQQNSFNVELMNKNHYEAVKFIPTYAMQTQQKNYNKKRSSTGYVESKPTMTMELFSTRYKWSLNCIPKGSSKWSFNAYLKEACEIVPQFEIPKNSMQQ